MNPWRSLRGLPPSLYWVALAMLINRTGTMVMPFLVLYLTRSVGMSGNLAGGILASYGVAALVAAPVSGWLTDRFSAARVATTSLALSSVVFALYPLAHTPASIMTATAALALANEAFRPAGMALFSQLAGPDMKRPAFALQRLAANLGMSVGPALGGLLAAWWFPALFFIDGASSLLAALVLMRALSNKRAPGTDADTAPDTVPDTAIDTVPDTVPDTAPDTMSASDAVAPAGRDTGSGADSRARPRVGQRAYKDLRYLYFLLAMFAVSLVFFQIDAALPLFLVHDLGMSESSFGLIFTINTGIIILIEVPLNAATNHWRARSAMALGAFLVAVGVPAVVFASSFPAVAATVAVWTTGEMILFPASAAYVSEIAPDERSGEYMGLFSMTFGLGFTIGPWAGVMLFQHVDAGVLWGAVLACGLAGASMLLFMRAPESPAPAAPTGADRHD